METIDPYDLHRCDRRVPIEDSVGAMARLVERGWVRHLALHRRVAALAQEAGVTPAPLALAWVLSRGEQVLPIPGTTNPAHLAQNVAAAGLDLPQALLARLSALVDQATVAGDRYGAQARGEVDTETFA